ncbi:aromatic amino acid transaminase [Reinekea blandensis]|uniref:Aspartate/tyrosine/aromatic aminotransferase n=1 Tax=Reinekea blandensis MED297 TaxID=314283 RepID=A4BJU3_9GAMM|nr:amino acid aminotransferase [Reinekea blandensis]EAR07610.1 Aspartate/tyrosine/aromatic aminotransferase [Reinekea sp. MED297] [Reinekea blandensis MED297]
MFEQLATPKGDPILSLIAEYRNDPRENKIDLGIGVYRNDAGITPVMQAVHDAEALLLANQTTKAYQGLTGDEAFNEEILKLVLTESQCKRAIALQTPGASGALRMIADLIAVTAPGSTVWISDPSYINHRPIMEKAGLTVKTYPYLNAETRLVNEPAMLATLESLGPKDVVLLHGCCHNPSGADISLDSWHRIAELATKNGFLPFIDIAYQGLGDSLEADAQGLQVLADAVEEMVISTSCSKNFGLYRDRTGAAIILSKNKQIASNARAKMCELSRGSYSMPPAHGAAIVHAILTSESLTKSWRDELDAMNRRVNGLRSALVKAFREKTQTERFDYFGQHKGMFSLTGLSDDIIAELKHNHGIYIVGGGRVNVAGLKESEIDTLVEAFIAAGA